MNIAYNMDCMEAMRKMPDKCFDLACVDPPYGGGGSQFVQVERERERGCVAEPLTLRVKSGAGLEGVLTATISAVHATSGRFARYEKQIGGIFSCAHWDVAPPKEYFDELARVSKNQIIWGGNYFALPPTRCFLVWRKLTISESFSMAMAEYAWTSFNDNAKVFECAPQGRKGDERFHPTQKPIELYTWIFNHYAKPGDKILDTHLGSGSSRIAAYETGRSSYGFEVDKNFYEQATEKMINPLLFAPKQITIGDMEEPHG